MRLGLLVHARRDGFGDLQYRITPELGQTCAILYTTDLAAFLQTRIDNLAHMVEVQ